MTNRLSYSNLTDVLTLIEVANSAKSPVQFRSSVIQGVGTLLESESCVWTELKTDLFTEQTADTSIAEISNDSVAAGDVLHIFNRYAWQHPAIKILINTGIERAVSISDLISKDQFCELDLYQQFYRPLTIEDQLTIGFLLDGKIVGLSVNRKTWGFSNTEHILVNKIAACTFPFYKSLLNNTPNDNEISRVMEMNVVDFRDHFELLKITERQAELLTLVAHGKSNKQIADMYFISEGTVRKHLENCFRRLRVNNRMSAVTRATNTIREQVETVT